MQQYTSYHPYIILPVAKRPKKKSPKQIIYRYLSDIQIMTLKILSLNAFCSTYFNVYYLNLKWNHAKSYLFQEEHLMEYLLSENFYQALLAGDVWCFLARY